MVTSLDKKTALVLIDLQKGIVQFPLANPVTEVLANAAKLVTAFRRASLPVVIVNVKPALAAAKPQTRKDAAPRQVGTFTEEWLAIAPEIKTEPGDIFITKQTWNAFFETALDEELKKRNIPALYWQVLLPALG